MNAFLLACMLSCGQVADNDELLKRLDADFEQLLKAEKNPQPLREAARLLAQTNQSSHWTNYNDANSIVRRTRSKAAVPLLLKYIVLHADFGHNTGATAAYVETLSFLTGQEFGRLYKSIPKRVDEVRASVTRIVEDWWKPNQHKINTGLDKMTPAQVHAVTENLLKRVRWVMSSHSPSGDRAATADGLYYLLRRHDGEKERDERYWSDQEVHPRMLPLFLARAGYVEPGKEAPLREAHPIPFETAAPLAALRKNGEAPGLEKIARDERQNGAVRLLCVLAIYWSGEDMDTQAVLSILEKENRFDRRLTATLLLEHGRDARKAAPKLIALLDDPNLQIRIAAIYALRRTAPPEALPKLRQVLDELHPPGAVRTVLSILGEMGTEKAKETLATFMESALEDPKRRNHLADALSAFETAVGRLWRTTGPQSDEHYREKAREALKWWRQQQKTGRSAGATSCFDRGL